jgi:predicted PurR-regulated permease PerM
MSYQEFIKRVITIFALAIFCVAAWELRNILMGTFLSLIIALSLSIPVERLQKLGLGRGAAIAITLVATIAVITLFVISVLPALVTQMSNLVDSLPSALEVSLEEYETWRLAQTPVLRDALPNLSLENLESTLGLDDPEAQLVSVDSLTRFALPILQGASNVILGGLANLSIIIIVALFLLAGPRDYAQGALMLFPKDRQQRALEVLLAVKQALTSWMGALVISMTVTGTLVWFVLGVLLGVPNSVAIAVIAAFATFIPNVGVILPIIPISIFTLADDPRRLPLVLGAYILIQQVEGNFITPSVVKSQLNIPAGVVFVFQLIAASFFGFIGVALAVPLLATVMVLVRELYVYDTLNLRGLAVRLQEDDGEVTLIQQSKSEGRIKVPLETDDLAST